MASLVRSPLVVLMSLTRAISTRDVLKDLGGVHRDIGGSERIGPTRA